MKITNLTQAQQGVNQTVQDTGAAEKTAQQQQGRRQTEAAPPVRDNVELSRLAKDIQKAAEIAKATPDVRVEKVAALKDRVQSGSYEVSSKDVATKMVVDTLARLT
ncbi:MAG: flagellar biosynthesis anti-sigma factor FlgM [Pseudomonadota bacterium]